MSEPTDVRRAIAGLSFEQRRRLEQWLLESRAGDGAALRIPRRAAAAASPLSFAQRRLWVLDQLEPGLVAYNVPRALRLLGDLDVTALHRALDALVERHESLRTTVVGGEGGPRQVVGPARPVELPVVDLSGEPEAVREAQLGARTVAEARRPFDLAADPLLRAQLIRLGAAEHVLTLTMHHIASDGWSARILAEELGALYDAFRGGRPSPLPPLPIQYADYAAWQIERLQGPLLERQLDYWRRRLAGSPPGVELPTDRPRPRRQSYRGARLGLRLPAALGDGVAALSRRERATPFMTFLAAFQTLLFRYTGQADVVVGSVIAGRTRSEMEPLIGFFVNTLVLRQDVSGDPTFRELLARVRETALGAYAHQEVPFERLVEELRPERSLDRSPLFQVVFQLQDGARAVPAMAGLEVSVIELDPGVSQFDLSVQVVTAPGELGLRAEYSSDLFDEARIRRLLAMYGTLLEGIVAAPAARLSALPLLDDAERRRVLDLGTGPLVPRPEGATLHGLVEAQVAESPDAVAVVADEGRLTYRELDARAAALARRLSGLGVGPDVPVAICVSPSLDLVVALLGVLKAGGAYLPLDPAYPAARLAFMLEDSRAPVLVTQEALRDRLPRSAARVVCLDADGAAEEGPRAAGGGTGPDDLAYVIYTSGSSGTPKGVAIPHRAIVNHMLWMRDTVPLGRGDAVLQKTAASFDASVWEFWAPLVQGARLVMAGAAARQDPVELARAIARHGATVVQLVPTLLRALVESEALATCPSLRQVFCGGEALTPDLVEQFFARCPAELVNLYGPTEATIDATWWRCERDAPRGPVPIGRPIPNTRAHVLDPRGQPVPVGVMGELHVGGLGLARGYLHRPELTAERFTSDPTTGEAGARLYRTGDQARLRPDGAIEFLGRADGQVKLRGYRIELGEVEAALRRQARVRDAAVIVRELGPADPRLIAYVVLDDAGAPPPDLRAALRQALPEPMVPSAVVLLEALPHTPNGKVDHRALPAPAGGPPPPPADGPDDPLAQELGAMWARLLRLPAVGLHESFFDLGGHSLLAVRLVAEVERRWGRRIPLAALFEAPTVAEMATLLRADGGRAPASCLVPLQPRGPLPILFCVPEHTGTVLCFERLARALGAEQPLYGLEPLGLDGHEPPQSRIEDMAARYLREIRAVQPTGPYVVGGYCFGGLVAFEMAQQLLAQGEAVRLVLFSTYGPDRRRAQRTLAARGRERLRTEYANLRPLRLHDKLAYGLDKVAGMGLRLGSWVRRRRGRRAVRVPHLAAVARAHSEAARTYVARPYPGPVTLFWAQHRFVRAFVDPCFGWRRVVTGDLDVRLVPATTGSVIQDADAAPVVAAALRHLVREPPPG